ncbi:hypothetical protein [Vineibacter terrae]|uniref:hypothetical protein n=1 Tax=Vineibacter terrae TaxID=2586908 RepID=UPI001C498BDF
MPMRPPRACGCGYTIAAGEMCPCQRARKAAADRRRPGARARGYDSKWQRESKAFLARPENRHCVCGCGRLADMVDHIIPHRGDQRLFWNRANWQPMASSPCHASRKQSAERRATPGASQTFQPGGGTGGGVEFLATHIKIPGKS